MWTAVRRFSDFITPQQTMIALQLLMLNNTQTMSFIDKTIRSPGLSWKKEETKIERLYKEQIQGTYQQKQYAHPT